MSDAPPRALLAGGRAFALPEGARAILPGPLRPLPLAADGVLGVALLDGIAVPVLAAAPGLGHGAAWVLLDSTAGRLVIAGEALIEDLPAEAGPLPLAALGSRPAPRALPDEGAAAPHAARAARSLPAALMARLGGLSLALPLSELETVLAMPPLRRTPGVGGAALGLASAPGGPLLVLDPARLMEGEATGQAPIQLAVFRHAGRRLGLPCAQLVPTTEDGSGFVERVQALLPELGAAPLGTTAPPPPAEPMRALLLCEAAGQPFALRVEDVVAAIAPLSPSPAPDRARGAGSMPGGIVVRGVVAHRGEVLPVLDGGERLGLRPVLQGPGSEAPMLRLAGARPVALAVSQVTGLRSIPERLITAAAGEGMVAAMATLGEQVVPVCRAAALAGAGP
ncbi:chemotaxis protein CheW [Falsiroseomonas sp. HW251]|uniref:chemotaxis protein CheW n=1 Tax=Falsiroseomonas sp. HW251 TaxID=3390998 RepID=UPI003D31CFA7